MTHNSRLHPGFLWGAATAPTQVEGNNINSDCTNGATGSPRSGASA